MKSTTKKQVFKRIFAHLDIQFPDDDPVWCEAREVLITGGWRSGKSTRGAARALMKVLKPTRGGLVWLLGPDYVQAQEEFRYLWEWLNTFDLIDKFTNPSNGSKTIVTKTGWNIVTKSARYPEKLGSVPPDMVVMCEPGQVSGEVYAMARGRLIQKRGQLMMVGTLEDDYSHPRWMWYENLASAWLENGPGSQQRAFALPTWTNVKLFPLGEQEPELIKYRQDFGEYAYKRRIAAEPVGVQNPCLPGMWREDFEDHFFRSTGRVKWDVTAIGVDYGTSATHPSSIAVVSRDTQGNYWVREVWSEVGGSVPSINTKFEAMSKRYQSRRGRVDPHQAVLGQILGGLNVAEAGPWMTEMRIGLANALVEDDKLYFDRVGPDVRAGFDSMRRMRRKLDARGRETYSRDLGDDQAQAILYALEELRGNGGYLPPVEGLGGMKMTYALPSRGATMVGRA